MSVFFPPCGRLTLTPGVASPASDVAAAIAIHYVSVGGNGVPIFDGASVVSHEMAGPLELPLDDEQANPGYHQAGKIYDLFAFVGSGSLKIGTGPAWVSAAAGGSSRGVGAGTTELDDVGGLIVNKNEMLVRFGHGAGDTDIVPSRRATYLGSFMAVADGVAMDTASRRLLFNAYNSVVRGFRARGPSVDYTYSTAAYRVQGGDVNRRVDMLLGLSGIWVAATTSAYVAADVQSGVFVAIGANSFSVPSRDCSPDVRVGTLPDLMGTTFDGYLPAGYNFLASLEKGSGAGTQSWLGSDDGHGLVGCFAG